MKALIQTAIGLILVAVSTPAHAMYMELDRPGLALPEGFPEETHTEIQQVLEGPGYRFLGGSALNWNTTLRYAGSTESLNAFLQRLAKCHGTVIQLTFAESLAEGGDWHVHHSAHDQGGFGFHIKINVASDAINLVDLVLPEIRGATDVDQASGGNH